MTKPSPTVNNMKLGAKRNIRIHLHIQRLLQACAIRCKNLNLMSAFGKVIAKFVDGIYWTSIEPSWSKTGNDLKNLHIPKI